MPRCSAVALTAAALLLTLASTGPASATADAPGASLTGPLTNLTLCTPYTYKVSVTSSKPHREALVILAAFGATNANQRKLVNLPAGRKWTGTFTEFFSRPADMSKGLQVIVMVLPPHRGYTTLYRRTYVVTPAPGQSEAPRAPGSCGPVSPTLGS